MYPLIVSPPFGTYFKDSRTTPVLGSFTLRPRPGRGLKIAQFALDNILHPVRGGWRNRFELRNPGIGSISTLSDQVIYSIVGHEEYDWEAIYHLLADKPRTGGPIHLEINLGCRNIHEYGIKERTLASFCRDYIVIVKLPAGPDALSLADLCARVGVHYLHVGNTLPDEFAPGSISGKPLKAINLPMVEEIARRFPGIPIIGGGGIYEFADILDYDCAGATLFSLGTIWFRPWKAKQLITKFQSWDGFFRRSRDERLHSIV